MRAQLMSKIRAEACDMTQAQAAKLFSVTQPRINDLLRGKIDKFGLDALVNMLAAAALRVEMRVKKVA
jgi:predicted XRE-type DNA-binding protein